MTSLALLDGDATDRQRRAWSIVAIMVGAILISRALPEDADSRAAAVQSSAITAASLMDIDPLSAAATRSV